MTDYDSIYEAIKAWDEEGVAAFLKTDADSERDCGWTPIHEAAREGYIEILQMLIEAGFEVNRDFEITDYSSDYYGSALSEALLHGNLEAAKLLIQHGADVNATYFMQDLDTPEAFFGEYDLVTHKGNCLLLAITYDDEDGDELLETMRSHGLKVDDEYDEGCTVLRHIVFQANPERTARLLGMGADVNQYVEHEYLCKVPLLVFAVKAYLEASGKKEKRLSVIRTLLRHGADLSLPCHESEGETVMEHVLDSKNADLVQVFGLSRVASQFAWEKTENGSASQEGKESRMFHITFSDITKFRPFLPEECQVSGGSYGFELALWLSRYLAGEGIFTSYPFCNVSYSPGGGPDWFLEYAYRSKVFADLQYSYPKEINEGAKILIMVGTECNDGDGYGDEERIKRILWHVEVEQALSARQQSAGCDLAPVVDYLGRKIVRGLKAEGIKVEFG